MSTPHLPPGVPLLVTDTLMLWMNNGSNGDLVALLDNKVVQPNVVDEHGNTVRCDVSTSMLLPAAAM